MRNRLLFVSSLIVMASCLSDDYDLGDVSLSPTIALPLAFGDLGLVELLSNKDSSYIKVYPDGLLYFYYPQTLASRDVRDLFDLPDNTSINPIDLPPGTLPGSGTNTVIGPINRLIDLNLAPEELSEVLLKSGTLSYSISFSQPTSPPNLPIEINFILTDIVNKTTLQPLSFTASTAAGATSLVDHIVQMNSNKFNIRMDLVIKPHVTTFIPPGTKVNVQLTFAGMDFTYIKGFLGDQVATLPPQSIELSVFGSSLKDATVSFVQPLVTMNVVNDYNLPCEVNFSKLEATKPGSSLPFVTTPASPINLNVPVAQGSSATTGVTINNAHDITNFGPAHLEYNGTARINKGLVSGSNFIADTSRMRVTIITEIPIYGKVTGILVMDTLGVDLGDIAESAISAASLKVRATNEMPLDVDLQIYFADENYALLDSVFATNQTDFVKASTVKANGDLDVAGVTDLSFGMVPERLNNLFGSKFLIIKATMNTARDDGGTLMNVKFKSSYRLKLHFGLLAKLKINVR